LAKAGKTRVGRAIMNNGLKDFHRLCRAASAPICEFHSLRKSFCTNLLEGAGGSKSMAPHAVQELMDHSSVETTIRCYSKVRKDAITVAREIVDRVAFSQQPTGKVKIA
jgi:integrase